MIKIDETPIKKREQGQNEIKKRKGNIRMRALPSNSRDFLETAEQKGAILGDLVGARVDF